ncbi:hypothetical protein BDF19DRAFT_428806 [Syncephalis fuscata]|nr:hypothetical protein BDF19DRAFT_428806 [Syncephalis fuscata]
MSTKLKQAGPKYWPVSTVAYITLLISIVGGSSYAWYYQQGHRWRQDLAYHRFADTRPLGPIPNAGDVLSNLAFAVVGVWGCGRMFTYERLSPLHGGRRWVRSRREAIIGSAYYHWAPNNSRLVWDRLPMTIAFTTVLSSVVLERFHPVFGSRLAYYCLVALGVASVGWWDYSEDLLPYFVVQFLPFPLHQAPGTEFKMLLGVYAQDKVIFEATHQMVSGHTLKHLIAAGCTVIFGNIILYSPNTLVDTRKRQ